MEYADLRKQIAYMTALCEANDAVVAGKAVAEKEPAEAADIATAKISASNIAIAGSGFKAELCGTISDEPTATVETLTSVGFDEKLAAEMIDEGARIRADALTLRMEVKP